MNNPYRTAPDADAAEPVRGRMYRTTGLRVPLAFHWENVTADADSEARIEHLREPLQPRSIWMPPPIPKLKTGAESCALVSAIVGSAEQLRSEQIPCALFTHHDEGLHFAMNVCEVGSRIVLALRNVVGGVTPGIDAILYCDVLEEVWR